MVHILNSVGWGFMVIGWVGAWAPRLVGVGVRNHYKLFMAIANFFWGIQAMVQHDRFGVIICGIGCAIWLTWWWYDDDGGGGFRRKMRKIKKWIEELSVRHAPQLT